MLTKFDLLLSFNRYPRSGNKAIRPPGPGRLALLLLLFGVALCAARPAGAVDESSRISANPTFAAGGAGWQISGDVRVEANPANPSQHEIVLGPGAGSIAQRIPAGAANHMMVAATLHSAPAGLATLYVRCLDENGRVLMTIQSPDDIQPGKDPDSLEDYFRPHSLTASVELVISKDPTAGTVKVTRAEIDAYHDDDPALRSAQDVSTLMQPFWKGSRVSGEAVLLTSRNGGPATGTLMFQPTQTISVTSYDGGIQYREGADFTAVGRTIVATAHSLISQVRDGDLLHGELAWNEIGGKQVLVTYEHSDGWAGPIQPYLGDQLPNTLRILRARQPLRIVAYGDSITFGIGSSHMRKIQPYQSPWVDLFAEQLSKDWNDPEIMLFNASQSGADSTWARNMAARMVGTLHPNLVIVAFGQNDFWRLSADAFAENISALVRTVQENNPQVEFLLVATMRFDPAYTSNPVYWDRVTEYETRLRAITGQAVQLVDMTAISGAVYVAKAPRDCLNDPLHPNDYLSRWYAQSLVAALAPDAERRAQATQEQGVKR
ncbi:MAG TPA: SGNH/GDSL hydrolase family protein [Acidobacteriaceae bacterium]|nr:SGNH/GDSL hydrolase family protein [Acidobacteriaceae bacterium]